MKQTGPCAFVKCGSAPRLRPKSYTRAYGPLLSSLELSKRAHFTSAQYTPTFSGGLSAAAKRRATIRERKTVRAVSGRAREGLK